MGFFVQTILAGRYIHHRELRLVSLESLSSVEYRNKKIFLVFVFYRELSRFKFWENRVNSGEILFTFCGIFDKNFANFAKIRYFFRKCRWFLFVKTEKTCRLFLLIICQKLWLNISKLKPIHQKQHEINSFSPVWLNLQEVQTQTPLTQSSQTQKGAFST